MTTVRVRAGDSDRQGAVDVLTAHFTEGRLDAGEYDDRVRSAYAAVYLDDLPTLFADLPGGFGRTGGPDGASRDGRGGPPWAAPTGDLPPWVTRRSGGIPGDLRGGRRPARPRVGAIVAAAVLAMLAIAAFVAFVGLFFWPLVWVAIAVLVFSRGGCSRRRAAADRAGRSPGPGWPGRV